MRGRATDGPQQATGQSKEQTSPRPLEKAVPGAGLFFAFLACRLRVDRPLLDRPLIWHPPCVV